MDVDKRLLVEHLQRLEQQAATVESLIDWDDTGKPSHCKATAGFKSGIAQGGD